MSFLDRILPSRIRAAAQREALQALEAQERRARIDASKALVDSVRHFSSATENRRRPDWNVLSRHADAEMIYDLDLMRSRSRLLIDGDAKAGGLVGKEVTNIIGPSVGVQATLPHELSGRSEKVRSQLANQAETFFRERVQEEQTDFDKSRRHSWLTMTDLRYRHHLSDGSVFVRYHFARPGRALPFCIEIIEAEQIETPPQFIGNPRVRKGLQFSADGEFEGVWVRDTNPSDPAYRGRCTYEFVPLRNELGLPAIKHYFKPHRATASQGLPWLNRVIPLLNDISDYKDAELQAKILEAAFAVFGTFNEPDDFMNSFGDGGGLGSGGLGCGSTSEPKRTQTIPVFKNQFTSLEKGEDIKTIDPSRPGNNFAAFMDHQDRDIGLGIQRSFERVSNNYGAANFSATRVSGIEDDVEYSSDFERFAPALLTPDWEWAMWALSVETGKDIFRHMRPAWQKYVKRSWDGLKDAKESESRIETRISDPITEIMKSGGDPESVARNLAAFEKMINDARKAAQLPPIVVASPAAVPAKPNQEGSSNGKDKGE